MNCEGSRSGERMHDSVLTDAWGLTDGAGAIAIFWSPVCLIMMLGLAMARPYKVRVSVEVALPVTADGTGHHMWE